MPDAIVTIVDQAVQVNILGADLVGAMVDEAALLLELTQEAAGALGVPSRLGQMPRSTGAGGLPVWEDNDDIGAQPLAATPTASTASVQFFNQVTTPGNRATLGTSGGKLTIAAGAGIGMNIPSCVCGTQQPIGEEGMFVVEGAVTALGGDQTGLVFAFLNGEPDPGEPTALTPAGSCLLILRGNGTVGLYTTDGATTFPGSSITGGSLATFTSEQCKWIVTMLSSTSASAVPVVGGLSLDPWLCTGLPEDCFFGGGLRIFGATCAGEITRLEARGISLDMPKRLYIDPVGGVVGAAGTLAAPMKTLAEAQFATDADFARRTLRIESKGGELRETIKLDPCRWGEIAIVVSAAQKLVINPTVDITDGWELVAGSTGGAVYKRSAADAIYPGNSGYGGYVEVGDGVTQDHGKAGFEYTVEGWALYSRLAVNTAANHASFVPGSYARHNSGDDAGYDFIRCWDDGDPNGKEFVRSIYGAGIEIVPSDPEGFTDCKVTLRDIEVHNAFLWGFRIVGCDVDIQNCSTRGNQVGFGFELDACSGRLVRPTVEGNGFDGIHADGTFDVGDRERHLEIVDATIKGIAWLPQGFGDAMSAHAYNRNSWTVIFGEAWGVGKDGAAMSGNARFFGYRVKGAIGCGITAYAETGLEANTTIRVEYGTFEGCAIGINANCGSLANAQRTIDLTGAILLDNDVSVLAHSLGSGSAKATVNALMVTADGGGAKVTNGTGEIDSRLSPTLV